MASHAHTREATIARLSSQLACGVECLRIPCVHATVIRQVCILLGVVVTFPCVRAIVRELEFQKMSGAAFTHRCDSRNATRRRLPDSRIAWFLVTAKTRQKLRLDENDCKWSVRGYNPAKHRRKSGFLRFEKLLWDQRVEGSNPFTPT